MSLIFGINLSNRIYLAADTRLSYFSPDSSNPDVPTSVADNLLKIEDINKDLIIAAAGSLPLAQFLIKNLKSADFINDGINVIKQNIKPWIASQVDQYLTAGHPYSSVCLLFGGLDRTKRKVVNGKKLMTLVGNFQKIRQVPIRMNDTLFRGISSKPHQPNPFPELPVSDSTVFAVLSNAKKGVLEIEEADWGECLAYGPKGFNKKDLPAETFGRFEFEQGSGILGRDPTIVTALIKSVAEKNNFATVGGSIVPIIINDDGVFTVTSKVHRMDPHTGHVEIISDTKLENGKIHYFSQEKNMYLPLIPISYYTGSVRTNQLSMLEM